MRWAPLLILDTEWEAAETRFLPSGLQSSGIRQIIKMQME